MSGCCSRIGMDEEKKELKLFFFAFIHPNQWYGAEPPLDPALDTHAAARSGSLSDLARRSTGGTPAGHRQLRRPACSGF